MTHKEVSTRTERKTTVTVDEKFVADLICKAIDAPDQAKVEFDTGCDFLREVRVTWTEVSDG